MNVGVPGWERLRHGGLLLDGTRLATLAREVPVPLDEFVERQLRQRAGAILDGGGDRDGGTTSSFVAFVLEEVCGLDASTGTWERGNRVAPSWGRRAITGETVKPRHLWSGENGGRIPVFLDEGQRLGVGRGRRVVSRVLGWLRAGGDHLAIVTNGRQWRLVFAGLDYEAWCEWDLDLWFEEGELSPQVSALRTLLSAGLWTPAAEGAAPPLLQAIRDTRKGQAELSEVLGERVREAVENLIRGHGEALSALVGSSGEDSAESHEYLADVAGGSPAEAPPGEGDSPPAATPEDIYRAACRVAMRLVVILFAESRELLPRDNPLYHGSYGLNGLLEGLEREAARGGALAGSFSAWPRVLALFRLVREGSHHPDLPVTAYGGDLFAPGASDAAEGLRQALYVFENACFAGEALPDRDVHEMLKLLTRTTIRIRQGRGGTRAVVPVDFSDLSSEYIGILYEGLLDYELKTAPPGDPVIFLAVGDQPALPLSRLEAMENRALKSLFERFKDSSSAADEVPEGEEAGDPSSVSPGPGGEEGGDPGGPDDGDLSGAPAQEALGEAQDAEAEHPTPDPLPAGSDERQQNRTRAEAWARRAAEVAGLVRKPRGRDTPERRLAFESRVGAKARQLVARVVLPGEWYLVRWGGTRKGSGSFYTRPGLAVPTIQRTLRPLAWNPPAGTDGTPNRDAPPASWIPKRPEEILALTVCDPACGSGTFPLAALRFLTDSLYSSLQHHGRIEPDGERSLVRLLGLRGDGSGHGGTREAEPAQPGGEGHEAEIDTRLGDELIPCPPDDERFEPRLKAVLRRHVVERCIYAVDLDPLAVELCRLSLWIETMDRTLPFGFLDHKVKCGNALVGAWFDQFRHYPVMAWKNREGGDKNHTNGVHFEKESRTKAIKAFVKDRLTPDLKLFLQGRDLFQEDLLEESITVHDDALAVLAEMHALPVQDAAERARSYRERLLGSPAWRSLKRAMDLWCACWFWPADEIEHAPLPRAFADPPDETRTVAERIAAEMRFFHWELEFPDVFREAGSGFDAILGNPPWETLQPSSMEFFSNIDPLYRSYGKQEALQRQKTYFDNLTFECNWLDYSGRFSNDANWMKHAGSPFGDPLNSEKNQNRFAIARGRQNGRLHDRWREARAHSHGYGNAPHPFVHRGGGKAYTYKLFLEAAHALLKSGGRMGFVVPSGLYSDAGTGTLRRLFMERCRWEWLFGIENRDGIFPIHRSYKFNPVIIEKGGATEAIRTAFMRRNLDDWERADDLVTSYTRAQIERFSPRSRAILEIQSNCDLKILEKIYTNAVLLGDDGPDSWHLRYSQSDFNMTSESRLFPPRPQWEAKGYRPDEYSRWLLGDWRPIEELWKELGVDPSRPEPVEIDLEDWLFDSTASPERRQAEARFVHGHVLKPGDVARTDWRLRCAQPPYDRLSIPRGEIPLGIILSRYGDSWIREDDIEDTALPFMQGAMLNQFDFGQKRWISGTGLQARWELVGWHPKEVDPQYLMSVNDAGSTVSTKAKLSFRRIAGNTDARTMIASIVPRMPCGDTASVLELGSPEDLGLMSIALNSFAVDTIVRLRIARTHVDYHYAREVPLPIPKVLQPMHSCAQLGFGLSFATQITSPEWIALSSKQSQSAWRNLWSLSGHARIRARIMSDAVLACLLGLNSIDLSVILRSCDRPDPSGDPKGFWRVDKDKEPELRHTVLTLIAFHDLESKIEDSGGDREKGIDAFLTQNHGEGWMLPETLRLTDYGLGHDERARHPQPVASRLGPRFYDWQLVQSAEESWRECHLHARNLLGTHEYALLLVDLIERRAADGEDYLDLLTDGFTRALLGDDGYLTILLEIRSRSVADEDTYWTTVGELRTGGHLDDASYGQLLDELHARGHLDDLGYRRRRGYIPRSSSGERWSRVAEEPAEYRATTPPPDPQPDLFE